MADPRFPNAIKCGYMVKCARGTATNYRKRYFVLTSQFLTYYGDEKSENPRGNLLVCKEIVIEDTVIDISNHAFRVTTPFESILLIPKSIEDKISWKAAISQAVDLCRGSLRDYMVIDIKTMLGIKKKKHFFILFEDTISCYKDHENTAKPISVLHLSTSFRLETSDSTKMLKFYEKAGTQPMVVQFEKESTYNSWKNAISIKCKKLLGGYEDGTEREQNDDDTGYLEILNNAKMTGMLGYRNSNQAEVWPVKKIVLTHGNELIIVNTSSLIESIEERVQLDADTQVVQTQLQQHSFQIVTFSKIIHLCGYTRKEIVPWIEAIKEISVVESKKGGDLNMQLLNKLLLREALKLSDDDEYYDVTYEELKPLGIALYRGNNWAIVKISNFKDTGVRVGSVLTAINHDIVLFENYQDVISQLKNWAPPLTLTFRRAPEKRGYLMKKCFKRRQDEKLTVFWRKRHFELAEGKLSYKDNDNLDSKIRREINLIDASISLIPSGDNQFYFRVMSGIIEFTMKAADIHELVEWATTLKHAIEIANGGAAIIDYMKKKMSDGNDCQRLLEEALEIILDEYQRQVLMNIFEHIGTRNIEGLEREIGIAKSLEIDVEFIDFAEQFLAELKEEAQMDFTSELHDFNANADAEIVRDSLMGERASFMGTGGVLTNDEIEDDAEYNPEDDIDESEEVDEGLGVGVNIAAKYNFTIPNKRSSTVPTVNPERALLEKFLAEDKNYESDIAKLYESYVKVTDEGRQYINVMQFSTIWRLVTGDKGNLFQEMQMFNRFDRSGDGAMAVEEFVAGFIMYSREIGSLRVLLRIKELTEGDNLLI